MMQLLTRQGDKHTMQITNGPTDSMMSPEAIFSVAPAEGQRPCNHEGSQF